MGKNNNVSFGNKSASVSGVLGGVAVALGVPWIILNYGQVLAQNVQTWLVIGSVALGGFIVLVSAFFGLVLPTQVNEEDHEKE